MCPHSSTLENLLWYNTRSRTYVSYLEAFPINLSSLFGFPSTLDLDSIEVHEQTVLIHLHATSLTATCPRCGTAGSRVHSRYQRTVADLAFGGRSLELKLLVRNWICPEAVCSQHIFAERFPELVQYYAQMT